MSDNREIPKKRMQSSHLDEEIRTDEIVRTFRMPAGAGGEETDDGGTLMRPRRPHRKRPLPRAIKWGAAGLVALFVIGFGASYFIARHELARAVSVRERALRAGVEDLGNFDLGSAEKEFSSENGGGSGWFSVITSFFSGTGNAVGAWSDLSGRMLSLTENIGATENDFWNALAAVPVGNGDATSTAAVTGGTAPTPLVQDLQGIKDSLTAIDGDIGSLSGATAKLGAIGVLPDAADGNGADYLSFRTEIEGAVKFLNALIPWFSDNSKTHHVLVLLENPSEMRPGGGFIGSYADISLRGGAVTGIAVHDIAEADAGFGAKIVPPVPLQLEETGWRPADGNWFFDFPTSASETIVLFDAAKPYADTSTTFDAAVALTPQAMADVLSVTGPIAVPDAALGITPAKGAATSTVFTADGLTEEIQAVVQAGQAQAKKASAPPKGVIGLLWQSALQDLAQAGPDSGTRLLDLASGWIADKDMMIYFADPDIEGFLRSSGAAGDEFVFPQNFNGDYLAVADTDVNSDKSELYVSSTVAWTIGLNADGTATDHVAITRAHHGDRAPRTDWWYRTTNQDYLQLFVPAGSTLENESGGFVKKVPAPVNYEKNGYSADPLVAAMQSATAPVFSYPAVSVRNGDGGGKAADPGKTVFSVWSRTYMASSSEVVFDYSHPLYTVPGDGVAYEFVLERPSGATGNYRIEVDAPLGYVFDENGLASFAYDASGTPPGRVTVDLTLRKM